MITDHLEHYLRNFFLLYFLKTWLSYVRMMKEDRFSVGADLALKSQRYVSKASHCESERHNISIKQLKRRTNHTTSHPAESWAMTVSVSDNDRWSRGTLIIDVCGYNKALQTIMPSFNGIQSNTMQQKNKTHTHTRKKWLLNFRAHSCHTFCMKYLSFYCPCGICSQ